MENVFQSALSALNEAGSIADIDKRVLKLLSKPKRVTEFSLPLRRDNGDFKLFTAYRVNYNDALGPTRDGTRFVPDLSLNEVKALALFMTIKHAASGVPAGGGKGGIKVNPAQLSEWELERLTRCYIRNLRPKGHRVDIPGADIGTNYKTQSWMLDEYEQITGRHNPPAINDKPYCMGGTLGSKEATGRGIYYIAERVFQKKGFNPEDTRIVVQGYGQVGATIARYLDEEGFKIIAVSDIRGGIYSPRGIDINNLNDYVEKNDYVSNFPGTENINNKALLELDCEVLIPAAVQNVINEENAAAIKADIILEGANGPVTSGAEEIINSRGIKIIPDVIVNAGGAIVCHYERIQGISDDYWELAEVNNRLERQIVTAYQKADRAAETYDTTLRVGAWITALKRISKAIKMRGWTG